MIWRSWSCASKIREGAGPYRSAVVTRSGAGRNKPRQHHCALDHHICGCGISVPGSQAWSGLADADCRVRRSCAQQFSKSRVRAPQPRTPRVFSGRPGRVRFASSLSLRKLPQISPQERLYARTVNSVSWLVAYRAMMATHERKVYFFAARLVCASSFLERRFKMANADRARTGARPWNRMMQRGID